MIGNDVVDLQLAKSQSNWQRKGFLEKQFTDKEIAFIYQSKNPFLQVWVFWSMKEAAYKCYTQIDKNRFFAPKKFECNMLTNTTGKVSFNKKDYFIKIEISDSYVYSVAFKNEDKKVKSALFFVNINQQSKDVKDYLFCHFPLEIELKKDQFGIPFLEQNQKRLPYYLSTSHHGNFGAYAILDV